MEKDHSKFKIFPRMIMAAGIFVAIIFFCLIAQQEFFNGFFGTGFNTMLIVSIGLAIGTFLYFLMRRERYLQNKVNEVENKYRELYELSGDGIVMTDLTGKILECNNAYANMLGYSKEEVRQLTYMQLTPARWHKMEAEIIESQVLKNGFAGEYEKEYIKKSGKIFPVTIRAWLIRNKEGGPKAMWGIVRDITEYKKIQSDFKKSVGELDGAMVDIVDLKKFKLAVDNASDHIVITDPDGMVIYGNKMLEKITGYSPDEVLGTKAGSLWKLPMDKEYYRKLWDTIKIKKQTFNGVLRNRRKNGEIYDAQINISSVLDKNGNIKFFVGIERDITKEKEIDRAKTEFISLASHQLRTPLSAIKWYSEMLLENKATNKLSKKQKEYLNEIYNGNERMIRLIGELLDVSRIEVDRLAFKKEVIDVKEIIDGVIKEQKNTIEEESINFSFKNPDKISKIRGDATLLRQVVQNLLANSLAYTGKKGKISCKIFKENSNFVFEIQDNGIGIPNNDQHRIFEKMFRAANAVETKPYGTGLGLYIVDKIITTMGGKVWFKSKEDEGTTFWFSLPMGADADK